MKFNEYNPENQLELGAELFIPKLILHPHLGVGLEERETPQPVEINIKIKYPRPPRGCLTDNIEHTLCYHTIYNLFQELLGQMHFQLIEHLGYKLIKIVSTYLRKLEHLPAMVCLTVHKTQLPLEALPLGAVFSLTEIVEAS